MTHSTDDVLIRSDRIVSINVAGARRSMASVHHKPASALQLQPSPGDSPSGPFAARDEPQLVECEPVKLQAVPRSNLLACWPAPPISPWAPAELNDGPERAYLENAQGCSVTGEVPLLGMGDGLFFRPDGGQKASWVAYSRVRSLALTRPLALIAPPSGADELRHRYRLVLTNGVVKEGESAGVVRTESALFLYPPTGESAVTRLLVPAAQVRSFDWAESARRSVQLGLQDVEMLADPPAAPLGRERILTTVPALLEALDEVRRRPIRRLGEVLVELRILTRVQLDLALMRQAMARRRGRKHEPLGEVLLAMGAVKSDQLKAALIQKLGILRVNVHSLVADPEALRLVPYAHCHRHRLIPLCLDKQGRLVVAMDNPMSSEGLEAVRFTSGRRAVSVLANWRDINAALGSRDAWTTRALLGADAQAAPKSDADSSASDSIDFDLTGVHDLMSRLTLETHAVGEVQSEDVVRESDSTLVRLVNKVILDAMESGASDIHFESAPGTRPTRIRMRRDGVLSDYAEVPARFRSAIVSRIKIMASLDIAEHRKHQDGKIDFSRFGTAKLELRVAIIPTANGMESVILRLLASAAPLLPEKLCLDAGVLARLRQVVEKPHGLLLVCGPTGSGKTTTLHSLISMINTPERKIWTAEDPVEITQEGLSQVQVNSKIGWSFGEALRSLLRADPDVIMIGEMRDRETAQTAVEASLTGHLVFSTLHTNSAPETVVRLLDLGVDPFKFGDSLLGVLAQRLVRRVCPACSKPVALGDEEVARIALEHADGGVLDPSAVVAGWRERLRYDGRLFTARGEGCDECGGSGYKGRLALHEYMGMSTPLRKLIHRRGELEAVRERALVEGMRTLRQDGIEKALMGLTTLQQVRAACG
jgi:type II secretory ATPase GspE/PulE/Tfp pilus assembly ATPase PilB-like protein